VAMHAGRRAGSEDAGVGVDAPSTGAQTAEATSTDAETAEATSTDAETAEAKGTDAETAEAMSTDALRNVALGDAASFTTSASADPKPGHSGDDRVGGRTAISVSGLTKRYGSVQAVRGIDFDVARGETFGFLGPNGAGKTTTIKILCTLVTATSGTALVAGCDAGSEQDEVRRNIGLVFQDTTLDTYLTAEQNLRFHASLYAVPKPAIAPRIEQVLHMVGLWDRKDSLVSTFSGGMQRRLEIARGLLHAPHVLFLDEPTVGLDPQTRASIWAYINELKSREDITIFLTTHYMDEAEHCDRIAIIDHGKIVAIDTPEQLKASVGKDRVQIHTADDPAAIIALADRFDIEAAMHDGAVTFSVASGEEFVPSLFTELTVPIRSVSVSRPSLDDVFMSYTGSTIRDAEASGTDAMRQMVTQWRGARR
jgi:ABC-2 type transport system ATP-binding protein